VKLFTFIFSFYILLLATIPCCVVDNCNNKIEHGKAGKQQDNDGCKNCSPFTFCSNYVGFTLSANTFQVNAPFQLTQQVYSNYFQSYLPQFISSFWQPPRLA